MIPGVDSMAVRTRRTCVGCGKMRLTTPTDLGPVCNECLTTKDVCGACWTPGEMRDHDGQTLQDIHSCPYQSEIHDDDEEACFCCPSCTQNCQWEV